MRALLPLVLIIKATFTEKKLKPKQFDNVSFYEHFKMIEQPVFNLQLSHAKILGCTISSLLSWTAA